MHLLGVYWASSIYKALCLPLETQWPITQIKISSLTCIFCLLLCVYFSEVGGKILHFNEQNRQGLPVPVIESCLLGTLNMPSLIHFLGLTADSLVAGSGVTWPKFSHFHHAEPCHPSPLGMIRSKSVRGGYVEADTD